MVFVHPKIPMSHEKKKNKLECVALSNHPNFLLLKNHQFLYPWLLIPSAKSAKSWLGSAGCCHRLCAWAAPTSRAWGFALGEASRQAAVEAAD
jgi:hypothetical protein